MRLPRTRTAQSGFKPDVVDAITDQTYADLNAIEAKVDGLIKTTTSTQTKTALVFAGIQVRHGLVVIVEGENTVNFGASVPTSGYRLWTEAYNSEGNALTLDVPPSGKSLSSFKVLSPQAGILNYLIFAFSKRPPEPITL